MDVGCAVNNFDLTSNEFGDDTFEILKTGLQKNQTLHSFDLR